MDTWTIYFDTKDHPGKYVARQFVGGRWTHHHHVTDTLISAREWVNDEAERKVDLAYKDEGEEQKILIMEIWR